MPETDSYKDFDAYINALTELLSGLNKRSVDPSKVIKVVDMGDKLDVESIVDSCIAECATPSEEFNGDISNWYQTVHKAERTLSTLQTLEELYMIPTRKLDRWETERLEAAKQ